MPWYAITSLDIAGHAIKREVLYKEDVSKVWLFISGRAVYKRIPDGVFGYFISEAETDESWDFDIDEPRSMHNPRAVVVPLISGVKK